MRQSISTFPEDLDSPFGPTFGYSISRLPRRSILLILSILSKKHYVDSFAPAQLALRANLRLLYLAPAPALDCQKEKESGLTLDYYYLTPEGAHFREILRCSLAQSNKYKLMRF